MEEEEKKGIEYDEDGNIKMSGGFAAFPSECYKVDGRKMDPHELARAVFGGKVYSCEAEESAKEESKGLMVAINKDVEIYGQKFGVINSGGIQASVVKKMAEARKKGNEVTEGTDDESCV